MDIVISQLKTHFQSLNDIANLFSPIIPQNISILTEEQLEQSTLKLA